ncbi:MAG: hypothetical protein LBS90_04145 [Oscillospiraceae bacterium]|jgi:hypothetical protein|nr:hypothetical protein [Oscillospiraceae bacterium]
MANAYYAAIKDFQEKLARYAAEVFRNCGGELPLRLGDYNLLAHKQNCLESSTAFGYIIEEFLVSKLEIYSQSHTGSDCVIRRADGSATASSYDCFSYFGGIKALVNVKADKGGNNAVAAINRLYDDYVVRSPEQTKCFLVLKVNYRTGVSESDGERKIFIGGLSSFFLEEIDYLRCHKETGKIPQDHRNWSPNAYNANSGRLKATDRIRSAYAVPPEDVSFEFTRGTIGGIFRINAAAK